MVGSGELLVIFCLILLLFGGKRLPELARSLGKGIREFKRACQGLEEEAEPIVLIREEEERERER